MFKKIHVFRVEPKKEIMREIATYCDQHQVRSGVLIGMIGSVQSAKLNYLKALPGKYETESYPGPLEIACAQGSIATKEGDTIIHIHIQLACQDRCYGGHLVEAQVFSTAEVVIGELESQLRRYLDDYTGLNELQS